MIKLQNINKTFQTNDRTVHALKNVSLEVGKGEIFGVIGFSGAGKSTLVRCINLLEHPTSGDVIVNGTLLNPNLTKANAKTRHLQNQQLRKQRKKIGMIFQQFNLMRSRTVFQNIAFPLKDQKLSKAVLNQKVTGLLELVGLQDKANAYPSQLSGGQKQRVGIARALANDPDILLCDEATSALDPQTTKTILKLLKKVNNTLGITIVIITHEMDVVKDICDRVAVMEDGEVKEVNTVKDIFANPSAQITKDFVDTTTNTLETIELFKTNPEILDLKADQSLVRIDFIGSNTRESVISEISQQFNVSASIIHANVEIVQNEIVGTMLVILSGYRKLEALENLRSRNINVEVIEND
ncbi:MULTISPECIES: methionine ABC transporter ATP-binding protein [unclassified Erysipelothrix]|uniref:methionine ABC transporter ATP-binding protein n=1 Tax=unclassified Erysipelothrix TaxID=2624170 RepID=UPI00190B1484|nr:ATP-binding cassette domain-containing protein [Erysipelothrix sp. strain 2 (EsS2-6-Brazil)]MBK2402183.1 ATP-binding cassette domain-containing protein [Erysipelothrix sp. strain 2 (EsS2-6-Brazil)]